jgi:hypothetical protein
MTHPLDGAKQKLLRADEHLEALHLMLQGMTPGHCELVPEEDHQNNIGVLRARLPKPPLRLSVLIGDFLFNIRSALDYLVWQLVLINKCEPGKSTMFPITSNPKTFADEIRRNRLKGVSAAAQKAIESLQPYHTGNESLAVLAKLHNTDKHQAFNLTTAVAHDTHVEWKDEKGTFMEMFMGGEELRDGGILGDIGLPLDLPEWREKFQKLRVAGEASIFVAFEDPAAADLEDLRIESVLSEIREFVRNNVIDALDPFFRYLTRGLQWLRFTSAVH